eukprot:1191374-Prorocentrum_minimum.AAC.4
MKDGRGDFQCAHENLRRRMPLNWQGGYNKASIPNIPDDERLGETERRLTDVTTDNRNLAEHIIRLQAKQPRERLSPGQEPRRRSPKVARPRVRI